MLNTSQIAFLLMGLGITKSFLSLVAQAVVAHQFGAEPYTDAYFVALSVPQVLGDFMIGGAVVFSLVPVSLELREKKGMRHQANFHLQALGLVAVLSLALCLLYRAVASEVIRRLAPGFSEDLHYTAVNLARTFSPLILFYSLSYFASALFLIRKKYFYSVIASCLYPIALIAFCLGGEGGWGDHRLVVGTLWGAGLQMLTGLVLLIVTGSFSFQFVRVGQALWKFLQLMIPIVAGVALNACLYLQQRYLASMIDAGSISRFSYAMTLYAVPGVFVFGAIQNVLYPKFSEQAAKFEHAKNEELLSRTLRFILFLAVPLSVFLILFSEPFTFLLFQRGVFEPRDTRLAASALKCLMIGFTFQAVNEILYRIFYARQKSGVYLKSIVAGVLAGFTANLFLVRPMGIAGIALGNTVGVVVSFLVLFRTLLREQGGFKAADLFRYTLRVLLMITIPAGMIFTLLIYRPIALVTGAFWSVLSQVGAYLLTSFLLYWGMAKLLNQPEAHLMGELVKPKHWLPKSKASN